MSGSCWISLGRRLCVFFHAGFCWVLLDFAGNICWAFDGHAGNCRDLAGFCWAMKFEIYVCTQHAGICRDLAGFCWAHIFDLLGYVGHLRHNPKYMLENGGHITYSYFSCWVLLGIQI